MAKKPRRWYFFWWALCALYLFSSFAVLPNIGDFAIVLLVAAVFGLFGYLSFSRHRKAKQGPRSISAPVVSPAPGAPTPPVRVSSGPPVLSGASLAYKYDRVEFIPVDGVSLCGLVGRHLEFRPVPDRVALYVGGSLIGYMTENRLANMVRAWQKAGDPVLGVVVDVDAATNTAFAAYYYYKDRLSALLKSDPDVNTYVLTDNRNAEMQDNISYCSPREECTFDYDPEKDKYLVSTTAGFDIGYLPANAGRLVDSSGLSASVFISGISQNDSGLYSVEVYLFLDA